MKPHRNILILSLLFIIYYLIPLNGRLLWQPDETRYAEISREMLISGNWAVPHFLDLRYFEKPVVGYWINNLGQWLFGDSNFAVRFGVVFSTLLTALMVTGFAWILWRSQRTAVLATVIYLTSFLVYGIGTYAVLDPMISLWLMSAMVAFWLATQAKNKRGKIAYYGLLGVTCGLGVMTKGFLALAIPVISVLPWVIVQKRWREILSYGCIAIVTCTITVLPWAWIIAQREPDFWRYFFWVEHIQRFAQSDAQHKEPFWYYLPIMIAGTLPWIGLLPGAIRYGWLSRHHYAKAFYLLGWVIMPLIFFSLAKGKLLTYVLPCFAPLSLLMARYVQLLLKKTVVPIKINGLINIVFGVMGTVLAWLFSAWGPLKHPLWQPEEVTKCLLVALAFGVWILFGFLSTCNPAKRWILAAGCPLGIALVIGSTIPQKIMAAKSPQLIVQKTYPQLTPSRYILSNDVGIAAGLAWELKRSDIILLSSMGELRYGLNYPEAKSRFIPAKGFSRWLELHRQQGVISLVVKYEDTLYSELPAADHSFSLGKISLLQYFPK